MKQEIISAASRIAAAIITGMISTTGWHPSQLRDETIINNIVMTSCDIAEQIHAQVCCEPPSE